VTDERRSPDEREAQARHYEFLRARAPIPPLAGCPIAWQPNALAPVFYGYRDYGVAEGSPTDVRVFFPSLDGSPDTGEILRDCGRYPIIVFAHGNCDIDIDEYLKWFEVPAQLARAGYVVAAPRLPQVEGGTLPSQADGDLAILRDLVSWLRTGWSESAVVAPLPAAAGLAGHSFGAGVAGRLAGGGSVSAFASLSGVMARATREAIAIPKLFIWGSNEFIPPGVALTDTEWAAVTPPKHRVVFEDLEHWDYLPPGHSNCENRRGPCGAARPATWDLLIMFFAKYLSPELWPNLSGLIPDNLVPPLPLTLTPDQQFFAGGWLSGFPLLTEPDANCQVAISQELSTDRVVPYVLSSPRNVAEHDVRERDLVPSFNTLSEQAGAPMPWVDSQHPAGGTVVPAGSTVHMGLQSGPVP
jgi:dienelactone hydrolase